MNSVLVETINSFTERRQRILRLYYQDNLTQSQIAERLECNQSSISFNLSKARNLLLKALIKWVKNVLNHSCENIPQIQKISFLVEAWLEDYYSNRDKDDNDNL
jgi:predicted DNA-binding protein YlxM (UPF0122 family)